MEKKTILFDIGFVLVELRHEYLFVEKLGLSQEDCDYLTNEAFTEEWRQKLDAGRSLREGIDILLNDPRFQAAQYQEAITAYRDRWIEMTRSMPESIEILHQLKELGYKCYTASNWSADTFPLLEQNDRLPKKIFDGIYISGRVHIGKPDPRFFTGLLEEFGIKAEDALFIDDSQNNCGAAENCGIKSILFRDAAQLRAALATHGIHLKPKDTTIPRSSNAYAL